MHDDDYQTLRAIVMVAYQESRDILDSLPTAYNFPMHGWDGALQLQIVRYA